MSLSLFYMTAREEPHINWFLESLAQQPDHHLQHVGVIDFRKDERPLDFKGYPVKWHVTPKPNPWQGPHRLTKQDFFAMANARSTALCLADTAHIAYVDDLSVLMPGWLGYALECERREAVILGAYRKVKELVVELGTVKSYKEHSNDSRLPGRPSGFNRCDGSWLYGCSLSGPVEAFLKVNSWPEDLCDGMGFEDVCMGYALHNSGAQLYYCPDMMTLESEEDHFRGAPMRRSDFGISPQDKSHAALSIAQGSKTFPNSFGEGGIRELRRRTLAGEPFPIRQIPDREWFTGTLLSEL